VGRRVQHLFVAWLVLAGAVMITVALLPGLEVDWSPGAYLGIAAVFALVNLVLGPVLRLMSFPVMMVTLGLFAFVINTGLFLLTAWLMDSHCAGLRRRRGAHDVRVTFTLAG
jgi:putative membrane protein